jgi:hypothetical protein
LRAGIKNRIIRPTPLPRPSSPERFFSLIGSLLLLSLAGNALALFYAWTQRVARRESEQRNEAEQAILRVALLGRGHVTAVEVSARSRLPLALVEATLHEMFTANQCLSDLEADGRAVYVFPQFDDAPLRREATEREILRLASLHNGTLSVEQVALATDLTIAQARWFLTDLAERDVCISISPSGDRFRFQGLMRSSARTTRVN